jgi:adenosylmethionine-8-amino-7-oxononanoate aminotransferase
MEKFFKYFDYGPAIVTRAEGPYVYNQRGKRFINSNSGLWNVAIGYGREELVDAACQQMKELSYASSWQQAHPRAIELAAKLVEICGGHYQHVVLGSNGSEVVEAALKMARQYFSYSQEPKNHKRYKVISLEGSYHGFTYGAISTAGSETIEHHFGPLLPGFVQISPPYCYRCPYDKKDPPSCGLECANALEERILSEVPETVAAFIVEPIMGDFGVVKPPDEFHQITAEICRKYGVLRIADEITTGFGRTGKLFYSQDWEIQPDILLMGEGITSGYQPLSALLTTEEMFQNLRFPGFINTV